MNNIFKIGDFKSKYIITINHFAREIKKNA